MGEHATVKEKFGVNLKGLRKAKGITQDQLDEAVGISKATISAWERGIQSPEAESLCLLADYFNVSVDSLLGRTDTTTSDKPFTTAGEIIDMIHRLEKSTATEISFETITMDEGNLVYPDLRYSYGSAENNNMDILVIRIPHGGVVGYFDKEQRVREMFSKDPVMNKEIDRILSQYHKQADSVYLDTDISKGE